MSMYRLRVDFDSAAGRLRLCLDVEDGMSLIFAVCAKELECLLSRPKPHLASALIFLCERKSGIRSLKGPSLRKADK